MNYNIKEVTKNALAFFGGDTLATEVWLSKYALKNQEHILEKSPIDSINRYIKELYRMEIQYPNPLTYEEIEELMSDYKYFILGGSSMYGVGNNHSTSSLSNCFVLGNDTDSYGGILSMDQDLVQVMKRRGGVGIDLSHLRPKNSAVNNAARTSTGAVSFMERFSNTTLEVAQEGRRGALMLTMNISHPDIEAFITAKNDLTKITGANISVKVDNAFMRAVIENKPYTLHTVDNKINIEVDANKIWNLLVHQAWKTAEPGILFWDTIINNSPADIYADKGFETTSTNPCAELPLCKFDSCRLGSLNIYSYVKDPFTKKASFNYALLLNHAEKAQKLMDDIVDLEDEKVVEIIDTIKKAKEDLNIRYHELRLWNNILLRLREGRRTGLGQTGLADAAAALGINYGTDDFIAFANKVQKTISIGSYSSSIKMARDRGAFPIFDLNRELEHKFLNRIINFENLGETYRTYRKYGRRNIANLTIAPNGSISILAQVSSGIEPVYLLKYNRRRRVDSTTPDSYTDERGDFWVDYTVDHPKYALWKSIGEIENPYINSTADKIDPINKVKLQGTIQTWIDHSISVTHNLVSTATEEQVSELYKMAWKYGCKGATIYRDGSRHGILSSEKKTQLDFLQNNAPKRPKDLKADAIPVTIRGEKFTVILGLLDDKPYEVFAYKGNGLSGKGLIRKQKKGEYLFIQEDLIEPITNDLTPEQEAITRGYSFGLRHGGTIDWAIEQLNKTKGDLTSFNKAIARAMAKYSKMKVTTEKCPECSHNLVYASGCMECPTCGYSKC